MVPPRTLGAVSIWFRVLVHETVREKRPDAVEGGLTTAAHMVPGKGGHFQHVKPLVTSQVTSQLRVAHTHLHPRGNKTPKPLIRLFTATHHQGQSCSGDRVVINHPVSTLDTKN